MVVVGDGVPVDVAGVVPVVGDDPTVVVSVVGG